MKNYRLYLFDFDYTLVNSEEGILKAFHRTLKKYQLQGVADEKIKQTIGLPMEDAVSRITGLKSPEAVDLFIDDYRKIADRCMTPGTHFFPDTVATLRMLRAQGAKIGIISSKTSGRIQEKFQRDDCTSLIDHIIGVEEVRAPKPAPEGIEAALAYFSVPREAALYTGDSRVDAEAAQNAGVDFAAVCTGTTPAETFEEFPHIKIMQHLGELLTKD